MLFFWIVAVVGMDASRIDLCLICLCATCVAIGQSVVCFPGYHGGEGRKEGKTEGECGEGLWRKEEDMSVGESTKSTVCIYIYIAAEK